MKFAFAAIALLAAAPALAQDVALSSEILLEKTVKDAQGKTVKTLEAPKVVTPGDPLVFKLRYTNKSAKPVENFKIVNPMPAAVAFVAAESGGAVYSVDGGKSWGALAALKAKAADGTSRPATPSDVTHVQFTLAQAIPAGGTGEVRFRGVVK